jgi:F0F1-type ATP synthase assembly protein I
MDNRSRTAISVLIVQSVITLAATFAALGLYDARTAGAAAAGGIIGIAPTILFSLRVFAGKPAWSAEKFLRRLYWAEVQKIALIIVLLLGAFAWLKLSPLPLLLTFAATTMAYWLVLLIKR